jgi:hypothetical protein
MAYGLWLMAYGLLLMAYGLWLMAYKSIPYTLIVFDIFFCLLLQ